MKNRQQLEELVESVYEKILQGIDYGYYLESAESNLGITEREYDEFYDIFMENYCIKIERIE